VIGAAWGLGFVLGPALGGLLGGINPRLPFWVAAGLTLLNALYGIFVLPESLPAELRERFSWKRANPFGSLKLLRSHHELLGLASVSIIYYLAHHVLPSVFVLYASYRYGWNESRVGLTLAIVGITNVAIQGGLVRRIVARFGERTALLAGLLAGMIGFAAYGMAPTGDMFMLGVPVFAFMGLFGPSAQGLMTRLVKRTEQGQLQGANSSLMGITGLIGPGLFTLTFATFIGPRADLHLPGAPFLLASLLMAIAALLAWRVTRKIKTAGSDKVGGAT
jgi:DHA1 family tetracycline resistance protein-like MFS transporter